MLLTFFPFRWSEQGLACIEMDPADQAYFLPLLAYLTQRYAFELPRILDTLDGYAADFRMLGCAATLSVDAYSFSLAFYDDAVRDQVLTELLALPLDAFE